MSLVSKGKEPHWDDQAESLLQQISELKEHLEQLPDFHRYERYPHLHNRMDQLINEYMRLLNPNL